MIAYHIIPYLDGYRIHRAITELQSVMIGGRYRMRKVTRFDYHDGADYPSRAAAQAVLCRLAEL